MSPAAPPPAPSPQRLPLRLRPRASRRVAPAPNACAASTQPVVKLKGLDIETIARGSIPFDTVAEVEGHLRFFFLSIPVKQGLEVFKEI